MVQILARLAIWIDCLTLREPSSGDHRRTLANQSAPNTRREAGTFGRAATLAYYPNKQMTTGEGGMIVTDDAGWE